MGRVKEAMIEYDSFEWEDTSVTFMCPKCEEESDGSAELPVIGRNYLFPIDTGIKIECIFCNESFEAQISLDSDESKITFDKYPKTKVEFDPVFSEDIEDNYWDRDYLFDLPESPYDIFSFAHKDVVNFIEKYGNNYGYFAMNRMIFSQSFSVFEAYLCDKFLHIVFENEKNRKLFIEQHKQMKNVTFSLSEMISQGSSSADEVIKKKITQIIKNTLFHNLEKTNALFHMYKMKMFASEEDRDILFKAVEYRHHCVHRNGYDLEGNRLNVFTKDYNLKIAAAMLATVEQIEGYM